MVVRYLLTIAGVVAAMALAACGSDEEEPRAQPADSAAAGGGGGERDGQAGSAGDKGKERPRATGTEIVAAESQYGSILFDAERQAIYLFDKEGSSASECYGECAAAWPPVLTKAEPKAGSGIERGLLGTTERDDGSTQVTYAGHPLYYYVDDPAGEVLCHDVAEFGGLWLVVDPSGEAVS